MQMKWKEVVLACLVCLGPLVGEPRSCQLFSKHNKTEDSC